MGGDRMTSRRGFLKLLGAAGALAPSLSWADVGGPTYLAAAKRAEGGFALFGVTAAGGDVFAVPLPDRAHAATVHPRLAQAVVFARRPGRYAMVIDCGTGAVLKALDAPDGLFFCGHGAYDATGERLYTTEADAETGAGRIGIWDATAGFRRVGVIDSGGDGPHECVLMPGGDRLAVGNGSLENGPDGRPDPIAVQEMRPNLSYIDLGSGKIAEVLELDAPLRRNSIRHLSVRSDGLLAFAMQWHGAETEAPPLLGLHLAGEGSARLLSADLPEQRGLKGYAGSVTFSGDGGRIAISSPIGGLMDVFEAESGAHAWRNARADLCGLAPHGAGFAANTGQGDWLILDGAAKDPAQVSASNPGRAWDNHMVALRG